VGGASRQVWRWPPGLLPLLGWFGYVPGGDTDTQEMLVVAYALCHVD
jgi:hypothetical protein